jgi:hypothetical protein
MISFPGKYDCTRLRLPGGSLLFLTLAALFFCSFARAQSPLPPSYPEVARLGPSSYCNPYFGFRLSLPAELRSETMHMPVQQRDHHILLAWHLIKLDRSADVLISAFNDRSIDPVRRAAKARINEAHKHGLRASGPGTLRVNERELLTVHVVDAAIGGPGSESSFYFQSTGYLIHIAVLSHEPELIAALEKAIGHMDFMEPGEEACRVSAPAAMANSSVALTSPSAERIYYGPALPTDLVDATLQQSLGESVPAGQFADGVFSNPALGLQIALPQGWQPLAAGDANRITELMRDPLTDPESWDRRRALFRSCARALFAAYDPGRELMPEVHPSFAIVALPRGCVPDLAPPEQLEDTTAMQEFAAVLLRSTGALLLERAKVRSDPSGRIVFHLDGTLPYYRPGERLARRLSLRLSSMASGPWVLLVYSVTEAPAAQRELESRIVIGNPSPAE